VVEGGNRQQRRLSRSVFSHIFSFLDISQTGTDIENHYGENVYDMHENHISEYRSNQTVKGGVIAVGCSTINMSSLQPLSNSLLLLSIPPREKIE